MPRNVVAAGCGLFHVCPWRGRVGLFSAALLGQVGHGKLTKREGLPARQLKPAELLPLGQFAEGDGHRTHAARGDGTDLPQVLHQVQAPFEMRQREVFFLLSQAVCTGGRRVVIVGLVLGLPLVDGLTIRPTRRRVQPGELADVQRQVVEEPFVKFAQSSACLLTWAAM